MGVNDILAVQRLSQVFYGVGTIIPGILMLVFYLITTFVILFGLMALTTDWELLWYIHPILIIIGCLFALWSRRKLKSKRA